VTGKGEVEEGEATSEAVLGVHGGGDTKRARERKSVHRLDPEEERERERKQRNFNRKGKGKRVQCTFPVIEKKKAAQISFRQKYEIKIDVLLKHVYVLCTHMLTKKINYRAKWRPCKKRWT
jgi:hypothetical protein